MRLSLSFVLLLFAANSLALEIDQAYRLIPHQQTPFVLNQSRIPVGEAAKLARLLSLAELAMVARVGAMRAGPAETDYFSQIDTILWQMKNLDTSPNLHQARLHILAAIEQQRGFFELYATNGDKVQTERNKLVETSHRHLITAYNILMQLYPQETGHNRQAFFDYLCALDFI